MDGLKWNAVMAVVAVLVMVGLLTLEYARYALGLDSTSKAQTRQPIFITCGQLEPVSQGLDREVDIGLGNQLLMGLP